MSKTASDDDDYWDSRRELGDPAIYENKDRLPDTPQVRKQAILKAWAAGMTFQEVAQRWGMKTPAKARAIIEAALAESDIYVDRAAERARFTLSLLSHHQKAATKASDDEDPNQMAWMRMDLMVIERIAKLLGLDSPTQVVVTPGADEFEKLTAVVAIANGAQAPIEADPMLVDDDD